MKRKKLGKSGLMVSEVSFGCMSLGTDFRENNLLLNRALDKGINFFDTADLYQQGENEKTVGLALKERRKEIVLATKVGNQLRPDGSGWDWNPRKAYILEAVDKSLKRLQTDYIDLYQLHGGTIEDPIDETIDAFEILKSAGKIRYYGISSIRPNVIREYAQRSNVVSVMMQYSLLDRRPEESVFPLLEQVNIGVVVRGALAKGVLAGKMAKEYLSHSKAAVTSAAKAIQKCSENRLPSQTALRFAQYPGAVSTIAAGIRTPQQLEEVLETVQSPHLNKAEWDFLNNAVPPQTYEQHR